MCAVVTEILLRDFCTGQSRCVIVRPDCYYVSDIIILVNEGLVKNFIVLSDQLAVTVVDIAFKYAVITIFFYTPPLLRSSSIVSIFEDEERKAAMLYCTVALFIFPFFLTSCQYL